MKNFNFQEIWIDDTDPAYCVAKQVGIISCEKNCGEEDVIEMSEKHFPFMQNALNWAMIICMNYKIKRIIITPRTRNQVIEKCKEEAKTGNV